jgi:hypothetical protein
MSYLSIYPEGLCYLTFMYWVDPLSSFITGLTLCRLRALGRPYVTPKYRVDLLSGRPLIFSSQVSQVSMLFSLFRLSQSLPL